MRVVGSTGSSTCRLCCCCRYLVIYVTEGCRPQNRLYYLDLQQVPKDTQSGALDFSQFDFFKGVWV